MSRKYTKEFKQEALRLAEQDGMTVAQAALDLGIREGLLYRWRQEAKRDGEEAFRGHGQRTGEQARLAALERQVKVLEMERDTLISLKRGVGIEGAAA